MSSLRFSLALLAFTSLTARASAQSPATYRVSPDTFWNTLDHRHPVVKRIKPGDIVITKTLDASGFDDKDVQRAQGSNPMVGPFYIEGAEPGDAIIVRFRRIRMNRATGYSSYRLGTFAQLPDAVEKLYANSFKPGSVRPNRANIVQWDLDLAKQS